MLGEHAAAFPHKPDQEGLETVASARIHDHAGEFPHKPDQEGLETPRVVLHDPEAGVVSP